MLFGGKGGRFCAFPFFSTFSAARVRSRTKARKGKVILWSNRVSFALEEPPLRP